MKLSEEKAVSEALGSIRLKDLTRLLFGFSAFVLGILYFFELRESDLNEIAFMCCMTLVCVVTSED